MWVSGLDRINSACGIGLCVDLSVTPFYLHSSGWPEGSPQQLLLALRARVSAPAVV